jgi:hypothetical protein
LDTIADTLNHWLRSRFVTKHFVIEKGDLTYIGSYVRVASVPERIQGYSIQVDEFDDEVPTALLIFYAVQLIKK